MRGPGSEPKQAPAGEDSNRAAGDALQSGGGVSSRSRLYPAAAGRKRAHSHARGAGSVTDDDDDELMLNVLRCHLTY